MGRFQKAVKSAAKLRLALIGPPGTGKTYSSLAIATALGQRVAVIDTEHGSASKYADIFGFDVLELANHAPQQYVAGIREAVAEGYEVVVIDSLSHAWVGRGGALEMHDNAVARQSGSKNSFTAWRDVTPHHLALVEAIVQCPAHVIATMRAKVEYVQDKDERGRTQVRKVGLAPVQRDGLEYEFDLVGDLDLDNRLCVTKSRIPALHGAVIQKPGADLAKQLAEWLAGAPPREFAGQVEPPTPPGGGRRRTGPRAEIVGLPVPSPGGITQEQVSEIRGLWKPAGFTPELLLSHTGVKGVMDLTEKAATTLIAVLKDRAAQQQPATTQAAATA